MQSVAMSINFCDTDMCIKITPNKNLAKIFGSDCVCHDMSEALLKTNVPQFR
jgi:hypothetical protein